MNRKSFQMTEMTFYTSCRGWLSNFTLSSSLKACQAVSPDAVEICVVMKPGFPGSGPVLKLIRVAGVKVLRATRNRNVWGLTSFCSTPATRIETGPLPIS